MRGLLGFVLLVVVCGALPTYIGGAHAQPGGIGSELQAERQLVNVLRGEHARASYRRCHDEITRHAYPDVRRIPADRVRAIRRTWENRVARVRASSRPRAECWRSHQWAESWAGRCVSAGVGVPGTGESGGNIRARSYPSGTYRGKWQMGAPFELGYGRAYVRRWGRADRWPEWAQDVAGYRGWAARGWWPWPNTARACGLL